MKKDQEWKEKIRQSKLGVPMSEEHKRNTSLGLMGRELTDEHKQNISNGLKGRTLTEETKKKISNSKKGINKGIPLTEDHKKSLSNGMKNYWKRKKGLERIFWNSTQKGWVDSHRDWIENFCISNGIESLIVNGEEIIKELENEN